MELRRYREQCDETHELSGGKPVEVRRNREPENAHYLSSSSFKKELSRDRERNSDHPLVKAAIAACNTPGFKGDIWGAPRAALDELADTWNRVQVDQAIAWLNEAKARGTKMGPESVVKLLVGFEDSPAWPRDGEAS